MLSYDVLLCRAAVLCYVGVHTMLMCYAVLLYSVVVFCYVDVLCCDVVLMYCCAVL